MKDKDLHLIAVAVGEGISRALEEAPRPRKYPATVIRVVDGVATVHFPTDPAGVEIPVPVRTAWPAAGDTVDVEFLPDGRVTVVGIHGGFEL